MSLLDILKQYTNPGSVPPPDVNAHFDAVAREAAPADLGSGIGAAMRSNATPPFGQIIGGLFSNSNPQQRAGILTELIQAIGPNASSIAGGVLGRITGPAGAAGTITASQANQVSPEEASAIASHAEQRDGSIVDQAGRFYAAHPALVKTMGVAALAVAMSHMGRQQKG
jgi:hypothetical protein